MDFERRDEWYKYHDGRVQKKLGSNMDVQLCQIVGQMEKVDV